MSLLSWARELLGWGFDPRYPTYAHGGLTWAGKPVSADGAMQISAWWRGVRLYAEVTGAASLKFYERLANDDRRQVSPGDHPIATLIALEPNIDQTTQEFWGSQAAQLAIFGNAYAEKLFIGNRIVGLQPLPANTHPWRNPQTGELKYRFTYWGKVEELPRDKVFHTKGFSLGGDLGISPLEAARQGLSISLATEQATGQTFSQGMRMSGFFTGPKLTPDQRETFTKTFIDPIVGNDAKAHYGILENGYGFNPVNIPPKDAEMLLSRRHNIEEIARFLGMPPILLGHSSDGQTMWGSGVEAILNQWLVLGLDSFWHNIEASINKRLLSPADRKIYYAEFDRDGLLRADSAARGEFMSKLIQNGLKTPNELRKKNNDHPLEGGDVLLISANLIPLTDAGRLSTRLPRPSAIDAPPTPPERPVP